VYNSQNLIAIEYITSWFYQCWRHLQQDYVHCI